MMERHYSTGLLLMVLVVLGAGWGLTQPLTKIAVSEGYKHFGLIFWQQLIGAVFLGSILLLRKRALPMEWRHIRLYVTIALLGAIVPNSVSYKAAVHLPSGVLSILIALVPMFAFPVALALAVDRFSWLRLMGLVCGLIGVLLILGPDTSLPDKAMVVFVPLALITPFFYGLEVNVVAKWGTAGLDPVQVLTGASLIGAILVLPLTFGSGQWVDPRGPWGLPDYALILSSLINVAVYSGYVWLVVQAGSVFAAQVSYLVTGFGVFWAMTLLGERYSGPVWAAMAVMMLGLFLVQPRRATQNDLAGAGLTGDTGR